MRRGQFKTHWRRVILIGLLAGLSQLASADAEFAAAWGPSVGSTAPLLEAVDQNGKQQDLHTLKGTNGLLFVFNRSVDW